MAAAVVDGRSAHVGGSDGLRSGSDFKYEEAALSLDSFVRTSPTIIRLSRCSTLSTGASGSESLRLRLVAENSHRLLSRRHRTQGGARGLSTPRRVETRLAKSLFFLTRLGLHRRSYHLTSKVALYFALAAWVAGLVATTMLGRRRGRPARLVILRVGMGILKAIVCRHHGHDMGGFRAERMPMQSEGRQKAVGGTSIKEKRLSRFRSGTRQTTAEHSRHHHSMSPPSPAADLTDDDG